MTSQPPALIFDFGNVLAFFDHDRARRRLAELTDLPLEEIRRRTHNPAFAEWIRKFEHGRIGEVEFARGCCDVLDIELSPGDFNHCWSDIFWLNKPISRLVAALHRQGHTLILGSNTNRLHARHFLPLFAATLDLFEHRILSFEIGCMKPAADFYRACVAAARRPAHECLFIDDLAENVQGAMEAGLRGIRYESPPQLLRELAAHRISPDFDLDAEP